MNGRGRNMQSGSRITEWVLGHRLRAALVLGALTVFLAARALQLGLATDDSLGLSADDPEVRRLREFSRVFGDRETLVVALEGPVFSRAGLTYIRELTEHLERVEGVVEVFSLGNAAELESGPQGLLSRPLLREIPESEALRTALRERVMANPQWRRSIVSDDGGAAAINVQLDSLAADLETRFRMVDEVRRLARGAPPGMEVHVTGVAPMLADFRELTLRDLRRYLWLTPLLICGLLFAVFRSWMGVVLPGAVIGLGVLWTLGVFGLCGGKMSMTTAMMPTVIAVICLSDVIHILSRYHEEAQRGGSVREVVRRTMAPMTRACFLTSLTTAVGFGSLGLARLGALREFGVFAAAGILISYALAVTVTPLWLSVVGLPPRGVRRRYAESPLSSGLAKWATNLRRGRRRAAWGAALLVCASAAGMTRLRVETQMSRYLPASAPSVRAMRFVQSRFAGFGSLDMVVSGPPGVFREPWALRELARVGRFAESLPEVDRAFSLADIVRLVAAARADGGGADGLPETRGELAETLLLIGLSERAEALNRVVSSDYAMARVWGRLQSVGTARQLELFDRLQRYADAHLDPRLDFQTTGMARLYALRSAALVDGQIRSFLVTLALIALLMSATLRSVRAGVLSMIPNLIPVAATLGLMGFTGVTLNVSTVMIAGIAVGIAVDDTIHFLFRYSEERGRGRDRDDAVALSVKHAGRAMVATSAVIAGGFSLFSLSSFVPNRDFGRLTAFTMLVALAADLAVLPLLVKWFPAGRRAGRRRRWT